MLNILKKERREREREEAHKDYIVLSSVVIWSITETSIYKSEFPKILKEFEFLKFLILAIYYIQRLKQMLPFIVF